MVGLHIERFVFFNTTENFFCLLLIKLINFKIELRNSVFEFEEELLWQIR